ncbi:MAG TPA: copper resistance protein CopC [Actinomycetota bacterium]|nr:copper resistance protein CopC [Actinomycetota bacterium]
MRTGWLLGLCAAAALLAAAPVAAGAADPPALVSTDPPDGATVAEAPARVHATFSEDLAEGSTMTVVDECGDRVDDGTVSVDGATLSVGLAERPMGRYDVSYTAVAADDGASTAGSFSFTAESGFDCDPEPPRLVGSSPPDGGVVHRAPATVVTRFDQELARGSSMQVFACGKRADDGAVRVEGNEMSVRLTTDAATTYAVLYQATGAGGTSGGDIRFTVHAGPSCKPGGGGGHRPGHDPPKRPGDGHGGHDRNGGRHDDNGGRHDGNGGHDDDTMHPQTHATSGAMHAGGHVETDAHVDRDHRGRHDGMGGRHDRMDHGDRGDADDDDTTDDDSPPDPVVAAGPVEPPANTSSAVLALALATVVGAFGGVLLRATG